MRNITVTSESTFEVKGLFFKDYTEIGLDVQGFNYFCPEEVCTFLGADWSRELDKIKENVMFSVMVNMGKVYSSKAKSRKVLLLPVEVFYSWFLSIGNVSPEVEALVSDLKFSCMSCINILIRRLNNDSLHLLDDELVLEFSDQCVCLEYAITRNSREEC